jgi:hypothetical protein
MAPRRDVLWRKVEVWLIHGYFHSPNVGAITDDWTLSGDLKLDGDSFVDIAQSFKRDVRLHPDIWPELVGNLTGTQLERALKDPPDGPKKTVGDLVTELRTYLA